MRLQKIQQINEDGYAAYVHDAQQSILAFHQAQNAFYNHFTGQQTFSNWEEVPILRKKDLQLPLKERISEGFTFKKVHKGQTSGSSGTPLHYAKDKFCHAMTWANIIDRFGWYDLNFNTSYQARFYGVPLGFVAHQKEQIKDVLSRRYRFPIFDLSDKKLNSFLNVFRRKKFDHINGHTSAIVLFAKFLRRKQIRLTDVCPSLKYCVVTSEMLFPDDKNFLQHQLGVPVLNEYGASELDLLAFTNPEDDFQVNSENLFLEIVDDTGRPVPNGTPGNILVTQFYNRAHPFIRYEIGDMGVLDEKSTLKKPILKTLLGRSNDNATLKNGNTVPGHTFYYVAKSALAKEGLVQEFMIVQNKYDVFTIHYVAERDFVAIEKDNFEKAVNNYLGVPVTVHFDRKSFLDRSARGKLKQFISEVS